MMKGAILLLLIVSAALGSGKLCCKNQNNKCVDWSVMYKVPRLHDSPHKNVEEGLAFFYLDSDSIEWKMSVPSLNDTNQALSHTVSQIYDNYKSKDVAYLMYNDEKPGHHVTFTHGHTKGVVNFDSDTGYWLLHSLPQFPNYANSSYSWPHNGLMYGQTFLCISMSYKQLDLIGQQLLYTYPWIYDSNVPGTFLKENPNIARALKKKHVVSPPWNRMEKFTSLKGQLFYSFAKYVDFDEDIYDAWLAPYFKSDMISETWQNGRGKSPSNCSCKYKVENVQLVKVGDVEFKETHDHAKWAVTKEQGNSWICIGGINRMVSQKTRAGGMVCLNHKSLWKQFRSSIAKYESCKNI